MFTEEIEIMKLLSEKYFDDIRIFYEPPKSIDEITTFEKEIGIKLPVDLKELYKLCEQTPLRSFSFCPVKLHWLAGGFT